MKYGIVELNKLLSIFDEMSVSDYLELYNKSLLKENFSVKDDFIETDISFVSNFSKINFAIFIDNSQKIIYENELDFVLCQKSNALLIAA